MAVNTGLAIASTAALIASYGTSSATTNAQKVAVSKTQQQTLKQVAKANLKKFQQKLASGEIKKEIKKKVKEELKERLEEEFAAAQENLEVALTESALDLATGGSVDAISENFEKGSEDQMDRYDFSEWDPSGARTAIEASMNGEDALTQAKAWVDVASNFDPTGWLAAASSFMHPKCSDL
jgi:16S rRNA C967 or C1407 C5-methylase (RsmB/RsmF family)